MSVRGTNMKLIHAFEQLDVINDAKDDETRNELLKKYGSLSPLSYMLSLNFNPKIKLDLPPGMPDTLKMDDMTNPDMMHPLHTQVAKLRNCFTDSKVPKFKKEKIFLDIVECISYKEVVVLVACKDKQLTELYPNVTLELVKSVFPSYV